MSILFYAVPHLSPPFPWTFTFVGFRRTARPLPGSNTQQFFNQNSDWALSLGTWNKRRSNRISFRESGHKKHRNILSHAPSLRKEIRISKEKQKHLSTPTSLPWHHVKHQPTNGYQDWHGIPLAWSLLAWNLGSHGIVLQKKLASSGWYQWYLYLKAILKA